MDGGYNVCMAQFLKGILNNGPLTEEGVRGLLEQKPGKLEIILTGRNAPDRIVKTARPVTGMKLAKHPLEQGIGSRERIEW